MQKKSEVRMRDKKIRTYTALAGIAVLTLAVLALGFSAVALPVANAASGNIEALNVGTCMTTDDSVFNKNACTDDEKVGDRKGLKEVDTLYATYAHDPKTAHEQPRVILKDSDLLKISIDDPGRDRRTGVMIAAAGYAGASGYKTGKAQTREIPQSVIDEALKGVENKGFSLSEDHKSKKLFKLLQDKDCAPDFASTDAEEVRKDRPRCSTITSSGTVSFGFIRTSGGGSFPPMATDGEIKIFGYLVPNDEASTKAPTVDYGQPTDFAELIDERYIKLDEDRSEGGNDTSPWLTLIAEAPAEKDIVIAAIYYQTSDEENLVGGRKESSSDYASKDDKPEYTEDERQDKDALMVQIEGDNDEGAVNLFLTETGRFTGRYEGYVRLTDADGNGSGFTTDKINSSVTSKNWGLRIKHGSNSDKGGAAVVGVDSGPVKISYRDSSGRTQTFDIEIDMRPPTIRVTEPQDGARTRDRSPDFVGSFEDDESGLAEDTFRLYAANETSGEAADLSLGLNADDVVAKNGKVQTRQDYSGFTNDGSTFGVFAASKLFKGGTDRGEDPRYIESRGVDDGDRTGRFDDDIRFQFDTKDLDPGGKQVKVQFQALVMDLAGNVGFSDGDEMGPTFINDLGKAKDRKGGNVIGWYSHHVVHLDDKDPEFSKDQTVTGFYGSKRDASGIRVKLDGGVNRDSISTSTFKVELDDGSEATVTDVNLNEAGDGTIYLKLSKPLATDATPKISVRDGEVIADSAGNEMNFSQQKPFEVKDGILPGLKVTLSGGSGSGSGAEGPDRLTRNSIKVTITSDEPLQGAPKIEVVCDNLTWKESDDKKRTLRHYIDARSGDSDKIPGDEFKCGSKDDSLEFVPTEISAYSRPRNTWEYTWSNLSGGKKLEDGALTVIAFARDRSRYDNLKDDQVYNYGAATAKFRLDTEIDAPDTTPDDGEDVKEARPFIVLDFKYEPTKISLDYFKVDGKDVVDEVENRDNNRFIYWPQSMSMGEHRIEVQYKDAAGNTDILDDYDFEVKSRGKFIISLGAGWNAISLPADPVDSTIDTVFTDPNVSTVIGWDGTDPSQPWRYASRVDGVWTTSGQFATLSSIEAGYGYWVHSDSFVRQAVALTGNVRGTLPWEPRFTVIDPDHRGWHFVGVIDQDGDQTENHFGTGLLNDKRSPVTAKDYLREYVRAYTWDNTFNRFESVPEGQQMTIGDGVWVFYAKNFVVVP